MQGSSDEFNDANIQLALAVARKVEELKGTRACIVCFGLKITPRFFIFKLILHVYSD